MIVFLLTLALSWLAGIATIFIVLNTWLEDMDLLYDNPTKFWITIMLGFVVSYLVFISV